MSPVTAICSSLNLSNTPTIWFVKSGDSRYPVITKKQKYLDQNEKSSAATLCFYHPKSSSLFDWSYGTKQELGFVTFFPPFRKTQYIFIKSCNNKTPQQEAFALAS